MPGEERERRERQKDRQTDSQTDRQSDRQTEAELNELTKRVDLWRDVEAKKKANCPAIEKLVLFSVIFCFLGRCEAVQLWMQHVKQSMNLSPTQVK